MLLINAVNTEGHPLEIYIRDGKIAAVGQDLSALAGEGETVLDAGGLTVLPAFVDLHCHWRTPGFEYKEDIETGSRAAAAGGYTFVNLMPNTKPVCSSAAQAEMVEQKAAEIDSVSASVGREISSLQSQKEELDKVRRSRNEELTSLDKDETQYRTSSQKLQQEAGKLNSIIKANRKRIEQMQKQIRQIIAEESRKNKAKPQTSEQREFDVKLSGQFEQNTGKLPYPVRGVIVNNYGLHSHTAIKGVVEKNQGVDIAAEPGAEVRAVFEGEVSQVLLNQWTNKVVLLRHGNYLTLYSNLASVNVKVGDRVTLNQPIGRIASSEDSNDCTLHFEVWKLDAQNNPVNLNPEKWLRR